jgi:hypothetical protein
VPSGWRSEPTTVPPLRSTGSFNLTIDCMKWSLHELGYFSAEGLDYEIDTRVPAQASKLSAGHIKEIRSGAYQSYEQGKGNKGTKSDVSCACHWTVNNAAANQLGTMYGKACGDPRWSDGSLPSMARGGKRERAGRPVGAAGKLDKEAHDKAKAEGIQPLDVLMAMIKAKIDGGSTNPNFLLELCKTAAPYCHAKKHESQVNGVFNFNLLPEDAKH